MIKDNHKIEICDGVNQNDI